MESLHNPINPDRMFYFERQQFVVLDFDPKGLLLDIGGGGEGIIGRMKGKQVVAIDFRREELEEAPEGPLKIVMDACSLHFLDCSFQTVTAFCTFMYISEADQERVFQEVFRVLTPGGQFLIWDINIPTQIDPSRDIAVFPVSIQLPDQEEITAGYGTLWPEIALNASHYLDLAEKTGFKVALLREKGQTLFLELQKPG